MRIKRIKVWQNPMGGGSTPSSCFTVNEYRRTKKGLKKNPKFNFWIKLSNVGGSNSPKIKYLNPIEA